MAMKFVFKVEVEVDRLTGKFATKDELAEQIEQALGDANPGNVEGDEGGEYEVTDWDVSRSD